MRVDKIKAVSKWLNQTLIPVLLIINLGCAVSDNKDKDPMHVTVFSAPMQEIITRYYKQEVANKNQKVIINVYIEHFTDTVSFKIEAVKHPWSLMYGQAPSAHSEINGVMVHIYSGLEQLSTNNQNASYYEDACLYLYGKVLSEQELEEHFNIDHEFFPIIWEVVLKNDVLKVRSYDTQLYHVPDFKLPSDRE